MFYLGRCTSGTPCHPIGRQSGAAESTPTTMQVEFCLRSDGFTRSFFVMLGGVKTKDVLSLAGAWIDCPQVLPPLHFPNSRDYSILLHCVVSNLFSARFRCGLA